MTEMKQESRLEKERNKAEKILEKARYEKTYEKAAAQVKARQNKKAPSSNPYLSGEFNSSPKHTAVQKQPTGECCPLDRMKKKEEKVGIKKMTTHEHNMSVKM